MALNPFRIVESMFEGVDRINRSFVVQTAARTASGITSRILNLKDYFLHESKEKKDFRAATFFTPPELAEIYAQLPQNEQMAITEHVKVAASDALTTLEGFAPLGANRTHRVIGRLEFSVAGTDGKPVPMHNMFIELWDRDLIKNDILARGSSDKDGRFQLFYDPSDARKFDRWDDPDLELRILEVNHIYKRDENVQLQQKIVYTIKGDNNVTKQTYDFYECPVPYWEYDPHPKQPTPRLLIMENSTPPQLFSPSRSLAMADQLGAIQLIRAKHRLSAPSVEQVQKDYPENLTMQLERNNEGLTRSDEYFGERILNGMAASLLDLDPLNPNRYWIHHHWNSYEQDGEHAAPDVDIFLEVNKGKVLVPVEIRLHFRKQGDRSAKPEWQTEKPVSYTKDHPQWTAAKRVARVSAALHAELDVHLGQTHFNLEQYAIAVYRNLRKSPIRLMLVPHLKEVVAINQEADRWLLGKEGFITRSQALTADAIGERLRQVLGTLDWKNWQPRSKICEQHTFAKAAGLFWNVLENYVNEFLHLNDKSIRKHWYEIHRFSQDLVNHSVPLFLCNELRRRLGFKDGKLVAKDGEPLIKDGKLRGWYETSERMDLTSRNIDAGEKAIQPITLSDEPQPEDLDNLKQVCKYVIYHATFFHTWMNSRQLDDGGEIVYSGLGLRYGTSNAMGPENDYSIAPPPDRASEQMWFANVLSKTNFGFIVSNDEHDIPAGFRNELSKHAEAFGKLQLDVAQFHSRLNI